MQNSIIPEKIDVSHYFINLLLFCYNSIIVINLMCFSLFDLIVLWLQNVAVLRIPEESIAIQNMKPWCRTADPCQSGTFYENN